MDEAKKRNVSKIILNYTDDGYPLYKSLGGHLFTLGSDAHKVEDYQMAFAQMKDLLLEFGIEEVVLYEAQQAHKVALKDLQFER